MGENSVYYRSFNKKQRSRIQQLKAQLPPYTHSYIDHCLLDYQVNTALGYAQDLLVFFEFLQETNPLCAGKPISEIPNSVLEALNYEDINEYQAFLSYNDGDHPHMQNTRAKARKMCSLRGFFRYQVDHSLMENNPTLKAAKGKRDKGKDIIRLDADEVHRLIDTVENVRVASETSRARSERTNKRDTAIIILLLNLGIRVSECVGLDMDDVNFDDNTITIVRKGGKEARLYFGEDIRQTLRDYIKNERPSLLVSEDDKEKAVFLSNRGKRMAVRTVEYMVKKYAKEAALSSRISPHKLRATYGTALYNQTGDIRLVADVLGHRDVNTTAQHYIAIDEAHRRSIVNIRPYDNPEDTDPTVPRST